MQKYKQDMPPPGGYAPITFQRVPLKAGWGIPVKIGLSFLVTGVGFYFVNETKIRRTIERIEMRCARTALSPMLLAEVDRMFLKQIRRNRDEEEKIMKNVEGWEIGKYKGQPVYLSMKPDEFFMPSINEYYAHSDNALKYFCYNISKI